ncbi:synaptotagmin-like protein 2 [Phycodurus eques]|uniref:synaptotagmin-like protein 2 n=1 Tax=Phycodurus eques TaxID=693459 RepID=UPI002ACD3E08|nr:synaptotagmin-like protein 2 [Phycodurus eques]
MIDLSFLTEEERGVIMTVLRRDAQLKQAEEQRIRKLESILSQGSSSDSKLKYLTGQWFYEAKSRRQMGRIHGSEIILASMKQRRASEGSFRAERPKAPGTPRSGVEAPQKPARCLDMPQEPNNAKNEDHTSAVHSPRMARHNPFNRASLIVVEPTEEDSETEPTSPLKYQQPGGSSQTSGTSMTSEGSSAGFRPIPKKRTFVLRRTPILSDSNGVDLDPQPVLAGVAPAPRQTLNQGLSGSSNRSKSEAAVLAHHSASSEIPQQLLYDDSQVLSHSSLEGDRKKSSIIADRERAQMTEDNPTLGEHLNAERILDHDRVIGGSVMSSVKEPEWQRTAGADPPISYDINFIESSDQKTQKRSQQKHSLKLTNQTSSPTGNDEDSIAKVLEWFNRSTDNLKTCGNNVENICKTPRSSSEDHAQSPKRNSPNSPHSQRQNHPRHESTAEKIKQLKSFWEQETSKPSYDGGKPKAMRHTKLNKRLTKSEFDLKNIGNNSGSDGEDRNYLNDLPLNQRIDKMSPTLGGSRAQFNSLLEFWDDATTDCKLKSPKRQFITPQPPQELHYSEPESRLSPVEMSHDRQIVSALKAANKNNLPELGPPKEPKKILKDSSMEDRVTRPPPTPPKEVHCPRRKKDSFSHSSSRSRSLRRATSMFALVDPEEPRLKSLVSPVHSQSRKQSVDRSQNIGRASDGTETLLARAFVPRDYSHYLGMANVPSTLAPDEEASEGLSRPVRTSILTDSEERGFKRSTKISPRHVWTNCNSTDVDSKSPVGSTAESWSNTRNPLLLNCKSDDDEDNPVRKALRRAEVRPKGLAKSMEDLAGSLSSRQEKGQELKTNLRRTIDGPMMSPSSHLFSDQDHLKKMSKSVPLVLQRELRGSAMTMYNGDFGGVEVQGSIQFSINYVQKLREFHIFVAQCRDLAAVDPKRGRSDPYVKSYLVPDKIHLGKKKTSVKKKTLNPTFNEILRYRVSIGYLRTQTLVLSVWHHDTFGRNNFLGEADVDLSNWNFDHTHMNDFALKPRSTATLAPSSGQGEMRLAIRFLPKVIHSEAKEAPTTGEIHIWVKECKSLPLIRATIDPYVKCFMLPDTSRKSRQKTRMLRRTAEPVFNHTMVYDGIREVDLAEACVELTVWDRDKLASSLLGGLRLGAGTGKSYGSAVDWMDSTPDEVALWERMVASPNEWAEGVLPLRMLNSSKTAFK